MQDTRNGAYNGQQQGYGPQPGSGYGAPPVGYGYQQQYGPPQGYGYGPQPGYGYGPQQGGFGAPEDDATQKQSKYSHEYQKSGIMRKALDVVTLKALDFQGSRTGKQTMTGYHKRGFFASTIGNGFRGGALGAGIGAAVGTLILPGVGTAVGAAVGFAVVGGANATFGAIRWTAETARNAVQGVVNGVKNLFGGGKSKQNQPQQFAAMGAAAQQHGRGQGGNFANNVQQKADRTIGLAESVAGLVGTALAIRGLKNKFFPGKDADGDKEVSNRQYRKMSRADRQDYDIKQDVKQLAQFGDDKGKPANEQASYTLTAVDLANPDVIRALQSRAADFERQGGYRNASVGEITKEIDLSNPGEIKVDVAQLLSRDNRDALAKLGRETGKAIEGINADFRAAHNNSVDTSQAIDKEYEGLLRDKANTLDPKKPLSDKVRGMLGLEQGERPADEASARTTAAQQIQHRIDALDQARRDVKLEYGEAQAVQQERLADLLKPEGERTYKAPPPKESPLAKAAAQGNLGAGWSEEHGGTQQGAAAGGAQPQQAAGGSVAVAERETVVIDPAAAPAQPQQQRGRHRLDAREATGQTVVRPDDLASSSGYRVDIPADLKEQARAAGGKTDAVRASAAGTGASAATPPAASAEKGRHRAGRQP